MSKPRIRAYSRYCRTASSLFGGQIRTARIERGLTVQEVAERAGISRGLLQRIEKGDLKCEIGVAFEVAAIVGVKLFNSDLDMLKLHLHHTEYKLALLPKAVRKKNVALRDDI